ncbi:NAD(P)/FAD-dependent oxidoreductase [Microlunatus sp. Y2014]|uniref:NAD(P)/FAD-dependent oxidoreductase n=1 Tax=Microlunatus sp. Y2014 TaxID=3418488 RepID=UPI003DA7954C
MTKEQNWDVIVIGGGAAGLSAALMLGRARRRTLVVDAGRPRNRFAAHMHGVLGHDGRDPAELLAIGRTEAERYGVAVTEGRVERIDPNEDDVTVALSSGETVLARAVIVATGMSDRLPDVPGLAERWGTTVLHCPYCHGWEVRDKRLAVLAADPMALHQVQLVRQWSARVTLLAGGSDPLEPDVEQRLLSRGIDIVTEPVVEVLGDGATMTGVRLADGRIVGVDAIFTQGQPVFHDDFLAHLDPARTESPMGAGLAVDEMYKTSIHRVWAAGNVVNAGATVPVSSAAGSMAGGIVNMVLVAEEFDRAVAADVANAVPAG